MSSLPVPQPNTEYYPSSVLALFAVRQRQPNDPPFDHTKRPKYWVDPVQENPADPAVFVQYLGQHELPDGTFVQAPFYMVASEAGAYNFPDALPPNVTQPSPAPALPPAWPVPERALLPDEEFKVLFPDTPPSVHRTDLSKAPASWTVAEKSSIMQAVTKILGQ